MSEGEGTDLFARVASRHRVGDGLEAKATLAQELLKAHELAFSPLARRKDRRRVEGAQRAHERWPRVAIVREVGADHLDEASGEGEGRVEQG